MAYIQNIELPTSANTVFAISYSFDVSKSLVVINDSYNTLLYIINTTTDDIIYNPLSKGRGGLIVGNSITLDYPMNGFSDDDVLMIAMYKEVIEDKGLEKEILTQQKITNKLLQKIYKPY